MWGRGKKRMGAGAAGGQQQLPIKQAQHVYEVREVEAMGGKAGQ